jgi:Family of unknown function (DUF6174)
VSRRFAAVLFMVSAALSAGCATTPQPSATTASAAALTSPNGASAEPIAAWREPATYRFVLDAECGERSLIGRFGVRVENGKTVAMERLDGSARRFQGTFHELPTLAMLLTSVVDPRNRGADSVKLTTDPTDGHPTHVEIDWAVHTVDDEECYQISSYVVDPSATP